MKKILPFVLGALMLVGAVGHVVNPDFYAPMVPDFIPVGLANVLATIAEAVIGGMLFLPKYRRWGGLGFLLLMLVFLPIHVWDFFKENPAVGAPPAPMIRLLVQFLLIYAGYSVYKNAE